MESSEHMALPISHHQPSPTQKVGAASNCTVGVFWRCNHFFIGCYEVLQGTPCKLLVVQNILKVVQFVTTQAQPQAQNQTWKMQVFEVQKFR